MSRRIRVVAVAVAVLALCAALAVALARSETRHAGFNSIRANDEVTVLGSGDEVCQTVETVPADTAAVEFVGVTGGRPGPPLLAHVRAPTGERVADGRRAGGYGDGKVAVPVTKLEYTVPSAWVCLRAAGRGKVALLGVPTAPGGLLINGKERPGLLTLAYRRAGEESALALLPAIAHRFGLGKTKLAGDWTLWVLIVLFAATSGIALRLVLARGFGEEAR
jgi:hypothetical protein